MRRGLGGLPEKTRIIFVPDILLRLWKTKNLFLDWLLKAEEDKISYDELKMLAQDISRWCQ